jgi:hypothetical protein
MLARNAVFARAAAGRAALHAVAMAALAAAAAAPGCGPGPIPPGTDAAEPPAPAVKAMFVVPREDMVTPYFDTPFPNDLRRDPVTGRPDVRRWPEAVNVLALRTVLDAFAEYDGFALNAALYFTFDGAVDAALLPDPAGSDSAGSPVQLVDVDPASPELGRRFPLMLDFDPVALDHGYRPANTLSILPVPGFPLREATRYAAVVTTGVRDLDGRPVTRTADMEAVLGTTPSADPVLEAARALYAPALDVLASSAGITRDRIASVAVFTTMHATDITPGLRAAVHSVPAPTPDAMAVVGETDHNWVYEGTFESPDFQVGEPPYTPDEEGYIARDAASGAPLIEEIDTIRFAVSVPKDAPASGGACYPIVVYNHGTGGDYLTFTGSGSSFGAPWREAEALGSRGIAVVSFDQPLHGTRGSTGIDVAFSTYDPTNPRAARDNMLQAAADDFQLVRMLTAGAPRPLRIPASLNGAGTGDVCFDPTNIYYMGHSQGGSTGPPFVAFEPAVRAVVLSGAGGGIQSTLFLRKLPVNGGGTQPVSEFVATILSTTPESLDIFHPALNAVEMSIEPVEPMNYGRLFLHPPPGVPVKSVHMTEGMEDIDTPPPTIEYLATAIGLTLMEPVEHLPPGMALFGPPVDTSPVAGNVDGGRYTAVLAQYAGYGHFAIYDFAPARTRYAEFLRSFAEDGIGTVN